MQYHFLSSLKTNSYESTLKASTLGFGCMGLLKSYQPRITQEEASILIKEAYNQGITFFDTSDQYADGESEQVLGKALKNVRKNVIINTKIGLISKEGNPSYSDVNCSPSYIKSACYASLERLGTDYIDVLYLHRKDPKVPIEESMDALVDLIKEGVIRGIGLSEVKPDIIERAQKIYPLTAIQAEYSLLTRVPEMNGVLETCNNFGIVLVAHCPLSRGLLTDTMSTLEDIPLDDFRRVLPRFHKSNFSKNQGIIHEIKIFAQRKNLTCAQVALAWLIHKSNCVIPIPSTKNKNRLFENLKASTVNFSKEDILELEQIAPIGCAYGARCAPEVLSYWDMSDETQQPISNL